MFCGHCGQAVKPGAKFCGGCGTPVQVAAASQDGEQAAPWAMNGQQKEAVADALASGKEALARGQEVLAQYNIKGWLRIGLLLMAAAGVIHLVAMFASKVPALGFLASFEGAWGGFIHIVWWLLLLGGIAAADWGLLKLNGAVGTWGPYVATLLVALDSISSLGFRLDTTLLCVAGSVLMVYDLHGRLRQRGLLPAWNRFAAIAGYRRLVSLGALVGLLSLWLTWVPQKSFLMLSWYTWGGSWLSTAPSVPGRELTGATLAYLGLVALIYWAGVNPLQLPARWLAKLPWGVAGYGALFLLVSLIEWRTIQLGELVYVVALAAVIFGAKQIMDGRTAGPGDLREIPLERIPWLRQPTA